MPYQQSLVFAFAALIALLSLGAMAEQAPRVSSLGGIDREFMAQQRSRIDDLARFNLGRQLRDEKTNDLDILQVLLDRRLVRADQSLELQAMGVVMGNLLAAELDMTWVIYEDRYGRSRALKMKTSENYLFPITMISRRAEVGARVDVDAIYGKAISAMEPYRRALPFR